MCTAMCRDRCAQTDVHRQMCKRRTYGRYTPGYTLFARRTFSHDQLWVTHDVHAAEAAAPRSVLATMATMLASAATTRSVLATMTILGAIAVAADTFLTTSAVNNLVHRTIVLHASQPSVPDRPAATKC